jgi:nitrite reductase/ring-hydroxylating ferredoxin subunit
MPKPTPTADLLCASADVPERGKRAVTLLHRGIPAEALLIRYEGRVYAYLNRCVHMPKALDCENPDIFDPSGRYLQCSFHTVHYEPTTGEALSEICAGKKLTAVRVEEREGGVYLTDKRGRLVDAAGIAAS